MWALQPLVKPQLQLPSTLHGPKRGQSFSKEGPQASNSVCKMLVSQAQALCQLGGLNFSLSGNCNKSSGLYSYWNESVKVGVGMGREWNSWKKLPGSSLLKSSLEPPKWQSGVTLSSSQDLSFLGFPACSPPWVSWSMADIFQNSVLEDFSKSFFIL